MVRCTHAAVPEDGPDAGPADHPDEREVTYRQIFTDGRPLPVDPQPSFAGYSSGKWEGDTLVWKPAAFAMAYGWMPAAARSSKRRKSLSVFAVSTSANLKSRYGKRFESLYQAVDHQLTQMLAPDTDLLDYYCIENEKDRPHLVGK